MDVDTGLPPEYVCYQEGCWMQHIVPMPLDDWLACRARGENPTVDGYIFMRRSKFDVWSEIMGENKAWMFDIADVIGPADTESELAQLRAMKAAIEKLYALPNRSIIKPFPQTLGGRTTVEILDHRGWEVIAYGFGDTLTDAIEAALAGYEQLNKR